MERRAVHGTDRRRPTGCGTGDIVSVAMAVAMATATIVGTTACASRPTVVAVPTFAPSAPTSTAAEHPADDGHRLPSDCEELLGQDELSALFGLPLGQRHGPDGAGNAVAVGRSPRADDLHLHGVRPRRAPRRGVVLRITVGAYRDVVAGTRPARTERGGRAGRPSSSVHPALGAAAATLLHRDAKCVLLTSVRRRHPRPGPDAATRTVAARRPAPRPRASRAGPAPTEPAAPLPGPRLAVRWAGPGAQTPAGSAVCRSTSGAPAMCEFIPNA